MRVINPIKTTESGNYLEQGCLKGLSKEQRIWAKNQLKKFAGSEDQIPFGAIRKMAIEMFPKQPLKTDR